MALVAGFINAIGLLGFEHQAVSHLTGVSTLVSLELSKINLVSTIHLAVIVVTYMLGAGISGLIIASPALKLGNHYSVVLVIESVFLFLAALALDYGHPVGHYLASAACGLQNGMVTTFSGATVRTTHLTGMYTDLGIMLGARIRGVNFDVRRALLYSLLILGFLLGGILGGFAFAILRFSALFLPALASLILAIVHMSYLRWLASKSA